MSTSINETLKRKYLHTYDSTITLKERVFNILAKYPHSSPKVICRLLGINYAKYVDTIKSYKWQYKKSKSQIGLHSKSPKSHKARAICRALKSMDRVSALEVGWLQTKNRNRCLIFKNRTYGRIEWWESGTILISIKKPQTMPRVKTFLCKAFFETGLIHSSKILSPFLDAVAWKGAHDVYPTSKNLPYTVIDAYKETHGIRIVLGDSSHKNGVEVQWVYPDYLERLELLQHLNIQTIENNNSQIIQFSDFMKSLTVPKTLQRDASRMVI